MTFDLFSSILCSGFSVEAAEVGAGSRALGWADRRVISERTQKGNIRLQHMETYYLPPFCRTDFGFRHIVEVICHLIYIYSHGVMIWGCFAATGHNDLKHQVNWVIESWKLSNAVRKAEWAKKNSVKVIQSDKLISSHFKLLLHCCTCFWIIGKTFSIRILKLALPFWDYTLLPKVISLCGELDHVHTDIRWIYNMAINSGNRGISTVLPHQWGPKLEPEMDLCKNIKSWHSIHWQTNPLMLFIKQQEIRN